MIGGFVWIVPCQVVRVVDGDTVVVKIDRGWRDSRENESIRLAGLWSPELRDTGGSEAKAYAQTLLPVGTICVLHSKTLQSLGRTVGDLRLLDGRDFATLMIDAGHGTRTAA